ncbi:MAG: helix-turn-helix transcriptional regulator [Candidatus Heimdallarchaeota archaeon]|nr:helix-turn-helix transcriptional regulator [Candidatus Heimdallarchaeota archaeon]
MNQERKKDLCQEEPQLAVPCFAPALKLLQLLGKKWSIQIIYLLSTNESFRYNDLRRTLHKGWTKNRISDTTLSKRLQELLSAGLLRREVFQEAPPRVEYQLSPLGEELAKALQPLIDWTITKCHQKITF